MTLVTKRNGKKVEFDRQKLELSMRMAGAGEDDAKEIADHIPVKNGISTDDIRKIIFEELRKKDPLVAQHYERTLRFIALEDTDSEKGVARISETTLHRLRVIEGETFHLVNDDKSIIVIAKKAPVAENGICLHEDDLKAIGVVAGKKITTKRQSEDNS